MPRLEEKLRRFNEGAVEQMPEDVLGTIQAHTRKLEEAGLAGEAVGEGDEAPGFELHGTADGPVALGDLVRRGPVILSFYRGRW